ncbi:MAG TPA: TatD family hydrolase [Rhodanobacteraceae bacterium]|nr:TatD family hydrolase [Rhodanobacteraceae bacterium]
MPDLIDSHCHLDAAEFDADRRQVLARARSAGVSRLVVPAIAREGFVRLSDLCAREAGLYPVYGLHPMYLDRHRPAHLDDLASWIERERPVAIGECGLDFHGDAGDHEAQLGYFRPQLRLARDFGLPLVLHARRAVDDVTAELRRVGGLGGVVHSFSGSVEQARQLWKLGFCIGIGGPLTYPRATRLRGIVSGMPIEFLLLETDSPDQPLAGHRGERNEPALLAGILATVAMLRGEDPAAVAEATSRNAERVFRLPAWQS